MKKLLLLSITLLFVGVCFAQQNNITAKSAEEAGIISKPMPYVSSKASILSEGFEGGVVPPTGWTETTTTAYNWTVSTIFNTGAAGAEVEYDPAPANQDEELISPVFDLSTATTAVLTFWFGMSEYWGMQQFDNYDLNVYISTNGGTTWSSSIFTEMDLIDTTTYNNWDWIQATVDLSSYVGNANCMLSFEYTGNDGATLYLDDIDVDMTAGVENRSNIEIEIYPSPANNILNISYNDMQKVEVYNIVGQKIYSKEVSSNNTTINTTNFENGTYVLSITTASQAVISNKFIVFK
jgi:Secretion system C-terminal sorting domain